MNYIKELNAFYDQMIFNPLSGSAIAVWHALMHFNNKSGWQMSFSVPAGFIELKSGVKSTTFKRARTELTEKGYIDVTPGSGSQSATYRMISQIQDFYKCDDTASQDSSAQSSTLKTAPHNLPQTPSGQLDPMPATAQPAATESANAPSQNHNPDRSSEHTTDYPTTAYINENASADHETDQKPDDTYDHHPVRKLDHNMARNTDHNAAPLVKQYINKTQTKPNITTTATDFYQQHFGIANPYITQGIERWIHDISGPLVSDAMKRVLEQNKPTWRYLKGILKSWQAKDIKTIQNVAADDHGFRSRHSKKPSSHYPGKAEVIPKWFQERRQKQALEQNQQKRHHASSNYSQAEREECERLLAKYSHKERQVGV